MTKLIFFPCILIPTYWETQVFYEEKLLTCFVPICILFMLHLISHIISILLFLLLLFFLSFPYSFLGYQFLLVLIFIRDMVGRYTQVCRIQTGNVSRGVCRGPAPQYNSGGVLFCRSLRRSRYLFLTLCAWSSFQSFIAVQGFFHFNNVCSINSNLLFYIYR